MDMLHSCRHQILGEHVNKTLLNPLDMKRLITADGISTIAYGYREAGATGKEFDTFVVELLHL